MYEPDEKPSFLSRFGLLIGVVAGVVIVVAIAVFAFGLASGGSSSGSGSESPTAVPSPTVAGSTPAEVALGEYVRATLNATYAGDCAGATAAPTPAAATTPGQGGAQPSGICSTKKGDREGVQAFALGQPLAEPSQWAFVEQKNGTWQVTYAPKITADNKSVPGIPWPLKPGAQVIVTGAAPCLNVREGPGLNQAAVDCIADGTKITVAAGPTEGDGLQWWQVEGRAGWVASEYLRYPDAAQ